MYGLTVRKSTTQLIRAKSCSPSESNSDRRFLRGSIAVCWFIAQRVNKLADFRLRPRRVTRSQVLPEVLPCKSNCSPRCRLIILYGQNIVFLGYGLDLLIGIQIRQASRTGVELYYAVIEQGIHYIVVASRKGSFGNEGSNMNICQIYICRGMDTSPIQAYPIRWCSPGCTWSASSQPRSNLVIRALWCTSP